MTKQPAPKKMDALALIARTALRDRRRKVWPVLIVFVLLLASIAGLIWKFWPRGHYPQLLVGVFDQIALPEEPVQIRAALEVADPEEVENQLAGCDVFFRVGEGEWQQRITDKNGLATLETRASQAVGTTSVITRYSGEQRRHRSNESSARLFTWKSDSSILLVEAVGGLTGEDEAAFWSKNVIESLVSPGAAEALRACRDAYKIAYFAEDADRPTRYAKLQTWMIQGWLRPESRLPEGPLLSPSTFGAPSDGSFAETVGRYLVKRFPERVIAVVSKAATARILHAVGVRVLLLGKDAAPEGVSSLEGWRFLPGQLRTKSP